MHDSVSISYKPLPDFPGVVVYEIIGNTPDQVQKEITRVFLQVETFSGSAEFSNPKQLKSGQYGASGYTFIDESRAAPQYDFYKPIK
jgi:hypothetical protein